MNESKLIVASLSEDDNNTGIFYVFEMQIGMNEFDHCIVALLKRQQEGPEKLALFRPEFFRPFSLLLKQHQNVMIKFTQLSEVEKEEVQSFWKIIISITIMVFIK